MNHLSAILAAYQDCQTHGQQAFLVTVMQTQGSTYRQVGAKMLISDAQQLTGMELTGMELTGMVSGGCLEQDILCHIQQCYLHQPSLHPFVITYDTAVETDLLWGFGLGCEGMIHLLVEPLTPGSLTTDPAGHPLDFVADCFAQQQPGVIATAFQVEGELPIALGSRLLLGSDGGVWTNLADHRCRQAIQAAATQALAQLKTRQYHYHDPAKPGIGHATFLLDVVQPPPALLIFGAGRDAYPLVQFAKQLGWRITLVDCRASEQTTTRFAMADQIILGRRESLRQQVPLATQTLAVVMTHNYYDDLAILKLLLTSPARYIGLLGSRQRSQRLLQTLQDQGELSEPQRQHLHTPIGLDIGAETPEEIALAIVAEIQAVLAQAQPTPRRQVRLNSPLLVAP
jgi:xanthine dehydrogenase accessory factor